MTNLEFIEKEIKDIKNVLDEELDENDLFIHSLIEEDYRSRLNDELQQLEQIKTKLEAWELVKSRMKVDSFITMKFVTKDTPNYRVIEKALKVDE